MRAASVALLAASGCAPTIAAQESGRPTVGLGGDSAAPAGDGADGADGGGACGLTVDLDTPYWSEGDTVTFGIRCSEPGAAGHALAVQGGPADATFDPDSGAFSWTTDGHDAGTYTLTVSADAAGSAEVPETAVVAIWVADHPDAPDATPPDPAVYTEEWGLPVVHVTVHGRLSQDDTPATITVGGEAREGEIKIRGAASTTYPKNSFTVDFGDEELSIDAWDGPSRGHLILTTTFDDNSYVRQKLIFDLWAAMAAAQGEERLTPRTFFTVLYLDGAYHGLYLGCDRIDDEFTRHMGLSGDGDLFKSVSHDANFDLVAASGSPKGDLAAGWEKKEGADPADLDPIRALTRAVGEADSEALWASGDGWVERDEILDWQLLVVFSLSEDSAGKNAYLYQDAPGEPLRFAPWDFNAAWGQNWYTGRKAVDEVNDFTGRNRMFKLLQAHPDGAAELQRRYATLADGGPLDPAWLDALIDDYAALIGPSADRDWDRWGAEYRAFDRWSSHRTAMDDWTDPAGEVAYLRGWIAARPAFVEAWLATLPDR